MRKTKLKEESLDTFSIYGLLKTYLDYKYFLKTAQVRMRRSA